MSDIEQRDKSMARKVGGLLSGELREWPQFPEQWTLDEYVEWFEGVRPPPTHRDAPPRHEHIVIEALREGKFVPALVLADYPEVDLETERDYKPRQERLDRQYKIAQHAQEKADDRFRKKYPAAAIWDAIKSVPDWNYGIPNTIRGIKYLVARIELDGEKYTVYAPIEDKGESRIYRGDVDSRQGEVPFAKHGVAYPGSVLQIDRSVVVNCIKSEGVIAMEKTAGNLFGYYINLDERGSFSADVRNTAGETVYEVKAGDELGEDESSIIEDGFMKNTTDTDGLCDYLKSLGIIPEGAKLLSMGEFEQQIEDERLEDDDEKLSKEFELGVSDSYDQSYSEAEEIAGERDGWLLAHGNEARIYEGRVLGVTEHHVVQSLGKTAVIHHKANLDRVPETDDVLSINYDGAGRGAVEPKVEVLDKGLSR